jgi:hypothetical protein
VSTKLYREIIEFLKNQGQVIRSFEIERKDLINKDVEKFIQTLRQNLCLLEEKTDKIIDGSDKE